MSTEMPARGPGGGPSPLVNAPVTDSTPESPLVSIVIPAYNHGTFVAEAVESVLAQDYDPIELIVIDDGSTDDTRTVLEGYLSRARVVFQSNAGQSAAINRGWNTARGEILAYLSADDRLEVTAVSTAVRALQEQPDVVMVYGDYYLIDPASRIIRRVAVTEFDYATMLREFSCAPGAGAFVRRAAAAKVGGWDTTLQQAPDFDYWLRLALVGRIARLPQVLAAQRVHPGSASYAPTTIARAQEPIRIMESYFLRTNLPDGAQALKRQALSSAHLVAARAHIRAARYRLALRSLRTAASLSPRNMFRPRTARLLFNAIVNRTAHRILWHVRDAWGRRRR